MFKLEIAGLANVCIQLRGCLGQVKAESKAKTPRAQVFDRQTEKVINIFGNVFTSAFRQSLKQQLPLRSMVFPEKIVKLYTEYSEVPGAYQAMCRAGFELPFITGCLDYNQIKYPETKVVQAWMASKGVAFRALNDKKAMATLEVDQQAANNLTDNVPAGTRVLADAAINLYNSRAHRPGYKGQANIMYKLIGQTCLKCGEPSDPSCDHVVPKSVRCDLSRSLINMQPMCCKCNCDKHEKYEDYRTDAQRAALFNATFKYKIEPADSKIMSLYVEYGLTRAQIVQVLDVTQADIKFVLYKHELFIAQMNSYIRGRRNYRLAYEARGVDTVSIFK